MTTRLVVGAVILLGVLALGIYAIWRGRNAPPSGRRIEDWTLLGDSRFSPPRDRDDDTKP